MSEFLRTVTATRYVTPLREGGSLPGLIEADDDGLYVLKFRSAGQGVKALVAELVAGEIGRALGLPVPEIVLVEVDAALGRAEPDFEVQALLRASVGLNLALDFLPGSLPYEPLLAPPPDADLASAVVWFDAYISNVDRTPRNPNLLLWHRRLWLIDHGAALYFQHAGPNYIARQHEPFSRIDRHVLLPLADRLAEADARLPALLPPDRLVQILANVPDEWLETPDFPDAAAHRAAFVSYLTGRLTPPRDFARVAIEAHAALRTAAHG